MRDYVFYFTDSGKIAGRSPTLSPEYSIELWTPRPGRLHPRGLPAWPYLVLLVLHYLRLFANRKYGVVLIRDRTGRIVHRSLVLPGFYRFPFMAPGDLQIGHTWTAPAHRGRGLAPAAILFAAELAGGGGVGFWYVVASDNLPSRRVVEKLGFEARAEGVRTRRFGTSLLGRYVMKSGA